MAEAVKAPAPIRENPVFRHVRLAFLVLLIDAALFVLTPPNPARSFFGVAALLATGYCALDLLVGTNDRLRLPEIAAFSVGLGILVTGAAALVMWGFGVPLTEGTILLFGLPIARQVARPGVVRALVALGLLLYAGVGVAGLLLGGNYLDYSVLAANPVSGQHLGILLVEFGVGTTVAAVMVAIFFSFAGRGR